MAHNLSGYHRALDLFEGLVAGVPRDGWDVPSPCDGWTARDVAGHVTGGQYLIRALAGGEPEPDIGRAPARFVPGDVLMGWRTARKECAAALTPAALGRPIPFGGLGELPLADYLEGYILEPLVQNKAVYLPPALILFAQLLLGLLAGPLGLIVATPFAAAFVVAVRMLYVEDRLGG